jgi:hypothetical protein
MFENLRRAWRQAVDNFWTELEAGDATDDPRVRGVYHQVASARNQVRKLEAEIAGCRRDLEHEQDQVAVCARRERLARDIRDEETARIAAEYRFRHSERVRILGAKLEALQAEHGLWRRELQEMERALETSGFTAVNELDDLNRHPREAEFRTLEDLARERAAAARLEELKRRRED